jgi:hypothetical protein
VLSQQDFISAEQILAIEPKIFASADADLYVIADASFVGSELTQYIASKVAKGLTVHLVEYDDLVAHFGSGLQSPEVINRYLKTQNLIDANASVLIVGGHTYDYLDIAEQGSVFFIPTYYRASDFVRFSPTDNPMADLDGDGLPDVAMGRWPVRDLAQLQSIINKTMAWDSGQGAALEADVLLIGEKNNPSTGLNFAEQLNDLSQPNESSSLGLPYWDSVNRLYASDFSSQANPNNAHQNAIKEALNAGYSLTVFNGHGSTVSWSQSNLLNVNGVKQLAENGRPSVVIPLACYTTYYEATTNETLANQLLFKDNGGAVAMIGAVTLGNYIDNGKVFERVFYYMRNQGLNLGAALMKAKRYFGVDKIDQANLWSFLGDPTLEFNANYIPNPPADDDAGINTEVRIQ